MVPVMISAYDTSGVMAEPFADAGWDCYCIDLEGGKSRGGIRHVKADMRDWLPTKDQALRCRFFCSFSPCTDVSVSGARWFRQKGLAALISGLELFEIGRAWGDWLGCPYFLENPVSTISSYAGKADYMFHPEDFTELCSADNYTKKTCLWTGGGFVMPEKQKRDDLGPPDDRIHKAPPSNDRASIRSKTPLGFAKAVFNANFGKA